MRSHGPVADEAMTSSASGAVQRILRLYGHGDSFLFLFYLFLFLFYSLVFLFLFLFYFLVETDLDACIVPIVRAVSVRVTSELDVEELFEIGYRRSKKWLFPLLRLLLFTVISIKIMIMISIMALLLTSDIVAVALVVTVATTQAGPRTSIGLILVRRH